jgi:hypothetical protein
MSRRTKDDAGDDAQPPKRRRRNESFEETEVEVFTNFEVCTPLHAL